MPSFHTSLSASATDAIVAHVYQLATKGPLFEHLPTEEDRLLSEAGFTDLRSRDSPPLKIFDSSGNAVNLAALRGQLVLLHFWGTGCVACIEEMPALDALAKAHAGRLAVLHVCADEDDAAFAQKHLDRLALNTIAYSEPTGLGLARFDVQALPTVWLIGADGKAIGRASGAKDWRSQALTKLIGHWLPSTGRYGGEKNASLQIKQ